MGLLLLSLDIVIGKSGRLKPPRYCVGISLFIVDLLWGWFYWRSRVGLAWAWLVSADYGGKFGIVALCATTKWNLGGK